MCGDSIDQLSKALIPDVSTSEVADLVAAIRGSPGNDSAESTPIPTPGTTPSTSPTTPRALLASPRDTVIYKATVLTLASGKFSATEAVAVRGDTIVATGTVEEVWAAVAPSTASVREVDYGSNVITPGFVEPHVHLLMTALTANGKQFVNLTYPGVKRQSDALKKLAQAVKERQSGFFSTAAVQWIAGFGFDPSLVENHPDLTIDDLDNIASPTGSIALYVINQSGHVAYVNTVALKALGIGIRPGEPGYPVGDENYQKNEKDGSLTGLLFEDAVGAAGKNLPKPTAAEAVAGARSVLQRWASRGITTAFDCGIGTLGGLTDLALLRLALDRRTLPDPERTMLPRFHGALTSQTVQDLVPVADLLKLPPWHLTNDPLGGESAGSVYGIKFWLDGSTQGFTAAVYEPYRNQPGNLGILNFRQGEALDAPPDDDRLVSLVQPFVRGGWQIVMHTNGARAFDQALRVYARVLAAEAIATESDPYGDTFGRTRKTHMHRLEHVTADITVKQLQRAAQLGLGVSHLIAHVRRWGDTFAHWVLGEERAARLDPVADAVAAGVTYSFHSDSPISEANPLQYVETAASRVLEATGEVLGPDQRITVEQAFAGITYNPARQLGRLDEVGSLEPGKKADFVVLDTDPRSVVDASKLVSSVKILETWVGGRQAFAV
ncbi:amidohydrolase 3 [Ophiostoma piceae UAMH 11346]|uniref:Amidohydrolase 3 n=1 Tax=Ophiostoma piceae (strain UAMH 11346) TaxID=1262450 RepID=S3CA05_OPHP1|nr:amidohydrolase 3 [Ophiostoma piceae UAMH 11346]